VGISPRHPDNKSTLEETLVSDIRSKTARAAAPGGVAADGPRPGQALLVLATAQLMVVLDATIVNVALPYIQRALGFSGSGLEWVGNACALAFGGLLLLGGRTGDRLGGRGPVPSAERRGGGSAGGTGCPVPGHPIHDDRAGRGGRVGAGQRERAESAALYSAEAAGQRHQPPAELAGRAGQHQPAPWDGRSGHPERGS
jgi:hypothetical protein